jgi:hypothetical protein
LDIGSKKDELELESVQVAGNSAEPRKVKMAEGLVQLMEIATCHQNDNVAQCAVQLQQRDI